MSKPNSVDRASDHAVVTQHQRCRNADCDKIAEYFVSMSSGKKTKSGLCRDCYERKAFLSCSTERSKDKTDKHRRTGTSGYNGGTGYATIRNDSHLYLDEMSG